MYLRSLGPIVLGHSQKMTDHYQNSRCSGGGELASAHCATCVLRNFMFHACCCKINLVNYACERLL